MRFLLASLIILLAFSTFPRIAVAQSEYVMRAQNIVNAWEKWLNKHSITKAAIAISHNDKILAKGGHGMDANDPAPVASLSKAITGICVLKLVEAGKLTYQTQLNEVMLELDSDVSIASLLQQTSGYTRDITQKPLEYIGRDQEYLEWVSEQEISAGRDADMIGKFHYNNANYAMLGAVIRKVTGNSYEATCNELVFQPIGITNAELNKPWRIMSAWGGWRLSAVDYVKFLDAYFEKNTMIGTSPEALPHHEIETGISYGLGYLFRQGRNGGFNFWHQGAWDYEWGNETARFGAYFAKLDSGWTIAINHNSSTLSGEVTEFDRIISEAINALP